MTRDQLVSRLKNSGHQYLTDADAITLIEQAALDTVTADNWRFRLTTQSVAGPSPVTIAGLGPIHSVYVIESGARRYLTDVNDEMEAAQRFPDITVAGAPQVFWVEAETLSFTPVTGPVSVVHFSALAWTTGGAAAAGGADTPRWPAQWHDSVYYRARQLAYEDVDDSAMVGVMMTRWTEKLEEMHRSLIRDRIVGPTRVKRTRPWA